VTIALASLIAELKDRAPIGVEIPRDITDNSVNEDTIERWALDAAGKINERRGKTTSKETDITLVEDQQLYDLPANCRRVTGIVRGQLSDTHETLGVPRIEPALGFGHFGSLPSGQEITPGLDVINRTRIQRLRREDTHELLEGQIRFTFPITAGEVVRVRYVEVDRTLASVPDDRFELIMVYLLERTLDRHIGRHGANISVENDSFVDEGMATLIRQRADKQAEWIAGLNAIGPEVA